MLHSFLTQFSYEKLQALTFDDTYEYAIGDKQVIREEIARILRRWSPFRAAWVTAVHMGLRARGGAAPTRESPDKRHRSYP